MEDIPQTAFTIRFGLFEFLRMPTGLKTSAQIFLRFMDNLLRDKTCAYNSLIASSDLQSYEQHMGVMLKWLDENETNIRQSRFSGV